MCLRVGTATVLRLDFAVWGERKLGLTDVIEFLQRPLFRLWDPEENHDECENIQSTVFTICLVIG